MTRLHFGRSCAAALSLAALVTNGCQEATATRSITGQVGGASLTAVYSRASKDYVRTQKADGSFVAETYVFKEGGNVGGPRVDKNIDNLTFDDVSAVIAKPLEDMNYVPSDDHRTAKLLIVVFWGTTVVPDDVNPRDNRESAQLGQQASESLSNANEFHDTPAAVVERRNAETLLSDGAIDAHMEAGQDAHVDAKNANMLGYTEEIFRTNRHDPAMSILQDEVEHDRYFVVLLAYDYQAGRFGIHRLLWETRFSIPETGNDFGKAFPMMASIAGKYFGQESHGLIHHNLADTKVEIGDTKSLGAVPEK